MRSTISIVGAIFSTVSEILRREFQKSLFIHTTKHSISCCQFHKLFRTVLPYNQIKIYTLCPKKLVHQTHGDNFVNSYRIFKILSLLEREVNFQQNPYYNTSNPYLQYVAASKVLPMKLRDSHCVFALSQCHYNLYKHSFVLRNLFVSAY